jgi:hypothetical protein
MGRFTGITKSSVERRSSQLFLHSTSRSFYNKPTKGNYRSVLIDLEIIAMHCTAAAGPRSRTSSTVSQTCERHAAQKLGDERLNGSLILLCPALGFRALGARPWSSTSGWHTAPHHLWHLALASRDVCEPLTIFVCTRPLVVHLSDSVEYPSLSSI